MRATVSLLPLELEVYRAKINVDPAGNPRTEKYGSSMDVRLYNSCSPFVSYISRWYDCCCLILSLFSQDTSNELIVWLVTVQFSKGGGGPKRNIKNSLKCMQYF